MSVSVIARKLNSFICFRMTNRFYVLESEPNAVEPKVPLDFRCFTSWSDELAALLHQVKDRPIHYAHRFEQGHRCYLALHAGEPVNYSWVSFGTWRLEDDDPSQPLAKDVAYLYGIHTRDEYRGLRISPAQSAYLCRELRQLGYSRLCSIIDDRNIASRRSTLRVGFRKTNHTVITYRFFKTCRFQVGGPPLSLSTMQESMPQVSLSA